MSLLDMNFKSSASSILVEKILEQGQRLRNSMVQAVLNNDPFNQEITHNINFQSYPSVERKYQYPLKCTCKKQTPGLYDGIDKYIERENLFLNQELDALDTRRSVTSLKQSTSSLNLCHCKSSCDICREYEHKVHIRDCSSDSSVADASVIIQKTNPAKHSSQKNLKCVKKNPKLKINNQISRLTAGGDATKHKYLNDVLYENQNLLKYVDSLKIVIYSLKLNNAGKRKVPESISNATTYYLEYTLPDSLIKNISKSKAKINTGLHADKKTRYCTKKIDGESIYFRQQTIHQIVKIESLDLSDIKIIFNVSFRSLKQRVALLIGKASFDLDTLIANRFLSCEQELVLMSDTVPVVLGTIKVSLQFGCDKLYFGKELIDIINCSKENRYLSENDSIHKIEDTVKNDDLIKKVSKTDQKIHKHHNNFIQHENYNVNNVIPSKPEPKQPEIKNKTPDDVHLFHALIFISEVRILSDSIDTYLICRGFSRDDTITSRTVYNECNPFFNLYQTIPILLDEEFINRLRDNYIIVEVWQKKDYDQLIGIAKLSLHQFYVAYRNPDIVKHLARSPHPVISVDWWEPLTNPITNSETGQLRGLVALGTQKQIEYLEQTRNLKSCYENLQPWKPKKDNYYSTPSISTQKFLINSVEIDSQKNPSPLVEIVNVETNTEDRPTVKFSSEETTDKTTISAEIEIKQKSCDLLYLSNKVDASTQSEYTMDSNDSDNKTNIVDNTQNSRDLLSSFLEQLRDMGQRNRLVENSTNTDECLLVNTPQNMDTTTTPLTINQETSTTTNTTNANNVLNETFPIESINSNLNIRHTSELLDSLQKALTSGNVNNVNKNPDNELTPKLIDKFKAHIVIESALHLPSRKKCKSKRNKTKHTKNNEEILPSTYVTFKSLVESDLIVTPVIPKSTNPRWDYRNDVYLPTELLFNNQKRLIFKVWRKANGPNLQPNFQTDIVLGFAAVDLTVLLSGLPNVQGWFNIVDFSSKCNGQIKIHVTPLENLSKFNEYKRTLIPEKLSPISSPNNVITTEVKGSEKQSELSEDTVPSELFSRALKRKFTELDEITQRLRQRLSAVTSDDFELANDDFLDDFERDLNTVCLDDDVYLEGNKNLVDAEENPGPSGVNNETARVLSALNAAKKICETDNINLSSGESRVSISSTTDTEQQQQLDSHLTEGKLKIDSLLEKLSLLTEDTQNKTKLSFTSRYVSGCSETNTSAILKEKENNSEEIIFNPHTFQEMFTKHATMSSSGSSEVDLESVSSSSTNTSRQAPDGAGIVTEPQK